MNKATIPFLLSVFLILASCSCSHTAHPRFILYEDSVCEDEYFEEDYEEDSCEGLYIDSLSVPDTPPFFDGEHRRIIGRWEIASGLNLVFWSEDDAYFCANEVEGILDSEWCAMSRSLDGKGQATFRFISPSDGSEIFTVTEYGMLHAAYPGQTEGTYYHHARSY